MVIEMTTYSLLKIEMTTGRVLKFWCKNFDVIQVTYHFHQPLLGKHQVVYDSGFPPFEYFSKMGYDKKWYDDALSTNQLNTPVWFDDENVLLAFVEQTCEYDEKTAHEEGGRKRHD